MILRDLGEGGLIQRIRAQFQDSGVVLGIGDDTAILDIPEGHSVLFCSDLLAEDSHFIRGLHPADSVGYKAVAVNVSDIGAMGGVPMHFVISFAAPGDLDVEWVDGFYSGIARACREFKVSLVGGDSSTAKSIFVDVAMVGRVKTGCAVRRSGAKQGDNIYITGALGGSAQGLQLLRRGIQDDPAVQRHLYPQPRHEIGAAVATKAHSMIDVSDGLSTDLGHILTESKVSARIYKDKIPAALGASESEVLNGGEEYELIVTASGDIDALPLTRIGEIIPSRGDHRIFLVDGATESVLEPKGWQHF
jgi:thiamine-monophosphate kinase